MIELRQRAAAADSRLFEVVVEIKRMLPAELTEHQKNWLSNEINGYPDAIRFYDQDRPAELPPFRGVQGVLKVLKSDGSMSDVNDPLAASKRFFISMPIASLQDLVASSDHEALVELPELTSKIGDKFGGAIVCKCRRSELRRVVTAMRTNILSLLDRIIKNTEKQRAKVKKPS